MSLPLVQISDISKSFGDTHALAPTSLDIGEGGEFVSLVGPSGCGKSTLLHIVGGLVAPSAGTVSISGEPLRGPRDDTSIVFQESTALPWRTVQRNAEFALESKGVAKKERQRRALELIDLVGLRGFERHYPGQLSGGMRHRIDLARALSTEPDLLLADEPFGALDEQTRLALGFELLRVISTTNCSVIFVTHSIVESVILSDRVLVMSARPGRIIDDIRVEIPRPRTPEIVGSPEVGRLVDRIWGQLRTESDKNMRIGRGTAA